MRFLIGPPPDDTDFAPEQEGWRKVREPSPLVLVLVGAVVGVPIAAAATYVWSAIIGFEPSVQLSISGDDQYGMVKIWLFLLVPFAFLAGLIVAHELIHALACPRFGFTRATVIGVWPSRIMPYACHLGALSHRRGILIASAPFLVLTVSPMLAELVGRWQSSFLAWVSIVNALVSGGDALIIVMLLVQIPLSASMRNKGWHTWWRPAEPGAAPDPARDIGSGNS